MHIRCLRLQCYTKRRCTGAAKALNAIVKDINSKQAMKNGEVCLLYIVADPNHESDSLLRVKHFLFAMRLETWWSISKYRAIIITCPEIIC